MYGAPGFERIHEETYRDFGHELLSSWEAAGTGQRYRSGNQWIGGLKNMTSKDTKVHEGNPGKQCLRDTSCPSWFMHLPCHPRASKRTIIRVSVRMPMLDFKWTHESIPERGNSRSRAAGRRSRVCPASRDRARGVAALWRPGDRGPTKLSTPHGDGCARGHCRAHGGEA